MPLLEVGKSPAGDFMARVRANTVNHWDFSAVALTRARTSTRQRGS